MQRITCNLKDARIIEQFFRKDLLIPVIISSHYENMPVKNRDIFSDVKKK